MFSSSMGPCRACTEDTDVWFSVQIHLRFLQDLLETQQI